MAETAAYQILRNGLVLDVAERAVAAADILIQDDKIREVGRPGMAAPPEARLIDATDRLLMPGLVNAHTHGQGSLGKGQGDKWSLELLLNANPWLTAGFKLEDMQTAARLNAAEMVLKGCTAAYDMYFEFPSPSVEGISAVCRAYAEVGVRAVVAPMMADTTLYRAIPGLLDALPEPHRSKVEAMRAAPQTEHIAGCEALLRAWPLDRAQVRPALGPTIPLHCSDEFIEACGRLAAEFEIGIQMHLAEAKMQAVSGLRRYGKTLTQHLDALGLIGPTFTGAHCIWLDDDDLKRMRDRGASVAHNPGSNLRLGSGIAPARQMRDLGIPVGIGTDGSASSDNQNMFEAMRMASFVSRIVSPDPEHWLGTWEVLEMATLGSAKALGFGVPMGKLAPGYKADIVFLDLGNVNFVPLSDAANQIVNCEDSSAVDSVMIDGRMVLAGRRFTSFDYDGLRRQAQAAADRLRAANAGLRVELEAMASFVSHHCIGLAGEGYHVQRRLDGTTEERRT
ncbi:MAG: amidohydrolase [Alphaproteobacteria bacterium]|nr:amidohydrolase [Alphaproteobacteria bacterium]